MNIYVGNLSYNVTSEELKAAFAAYGEVSSANIIIDKNSGQSKGFAFVEMPVDAQAEEAIEALNETPLSGRNMRINQARPKEDRPERTERRPRF
jgi:RNA recognition motif-containing protein